MTKTRLEEEDKNNMENNKKRIIKASQNLRHVGQRMLDRKDNRGNALFKIAQSLEDSAQTPQEVLPGSPGANDPADVSMTMGDGQSLNSAPQSTKPYSESGTGSNSGHHPDIPSYVNMDQQKPMVDARKTHVCTVTFKADNDVEESDMMNYILGIGDKLPVDVDGFTWKSSEAKDKG